MNPIDGTVFFRFRVFFNPRRLELLWWLYLGIWSLELLASIAPIFVYQHGGGIMIWLTYLLIPLYLVMRLAVVRLLIEVALVLLTDPDKTDDR
jgi:hypothetical protein